MTLRYEHTSLFLARCDNVVEFFHDNIRLTWLPALVCCLSVLCCSVISHVCPFYNLLFFFSLNFLVAIFFATSFCFFSLAICLLLLLTLLLCGVIFQSESVFLIDLYYYLHCFISFSPPPQSVHTAASSTSLPTQSRLESWLPLILSWQYH